MVLDSAVVGFKTIFQTTYFLCCRLLSSQVFALNTDWHEECVYQMKNSTNAVSSQISSTSFKRSFVQK